MKLCSIRQRLKETQNRIKRLRHLPISIQEKAHKIQTGAWTYGMYGIDTHYVGPQHFNKLRRSVVEAFIGNKPHGSTWLALAMLSKYVMDPLLFVILSICRLIRRCFTYHPHLAMGIVHIPICCFHIRVRGSLHRVFLGRSMMDFAGTFLRISIGCPEKSNVVFSLPRRRAPKSM